MIHMALLIMVDYQKQLESLSDDRKIPNILFYCYGETCANSYEAALAVRKLGYKNVYWLLNGFGEWKEYKFPITENP